MDRRSFVHRLFAAVAGIVAAPMAAWGSATKPNFKRMKFNEEDREGENEKVATCNFGLLLSGIKPEKFHHIYELIYKDKRNPYSGFYIKDDASWLYEDRVDRIDISVHNRKRFITKKDIYDLIENCSVYFEQDSGWGFSTEPASIDGVKSVMVDWDINGKTWHDIITKAKSMSATKMEIWSGPAGDYQRMGEIDLEMSKGDPVLSFPWSLIHFHSKTNREVGIVLADGICDWSGGPKIVED